MIYIICMIVGILYLLQVFEKKFYPKEVHGTQGFKENYKNHRLFYLEILATIITFGLGIFHFTFGMGMRASPFFAIFLVSIFSLGTFKYRMSREAIAFIIPLLTLITMILTTFYTEKSFGLFGLLYLPVLSYVMGKRILSLFYLLATSLFYLFLSFNLFEYNPLHQLASYFGNMPVGLILSFNTTMFVFYFIVVVLDVTAEYGLKLLIEENDKRQETMKRLVETNQTKDQLFSILGHDLVSPVTQVKMLLEMGKIKGACEDDETLQRADESADRAISLMRNLTEWARSQWGSMEPRPITFHLKDLVQTVMDSLALIAVEKGIKLDNLVPPVVELVSDVEMMTSIVRNLLTNALKFTPAMGAIIVNAEHDKEWVEILVEDSGIGIPGEKISTIFKSDPSKVRRGTNHEPGTGLGLILCADFTRRLGGTISVSSEVGEGTQFRVKVPLRI